MNGKRKYWKAFRGINHTRLISKEITTTIPQSSSETPSLAAVPPNIKHQAAPDQIRSDQIFFSLSLLRTSFSHNRWLVHWTPAASNPSSPSTSTHHPSPPAPPSPAITASKCPWAYSRTASSKVPGCSQTAGIPTECASCSTWRVTGGGVTTDSEVWLGEGSLLGEGTVSYAREGRLICGARGFNGVTGSECW